MCVYVKDQREYAIKKLNKAIVKEKLGNLQGIRKEIEIHSKLIHPNIIRLYSYYEDDEDFYLLMENTQEGNLYQLLKRRKQLNEKEAFSYFIQAAKAVYFLHDHNYIHRDIKPENLLLSNETEIKLCDFGLCNNNSIGNRSTFCGTLEYMAPEILSENSYDKAVDIWSLGVLLYELTNGKTPFKINLQNITNQTHSLSFINLKLSFQCKELIQKMLCLNPKKRITIRGLFEEEIISELLKNKEPCQKTNTIKNLNYSAIRPTNISLASTKNESYNIGSQQRKEDNKSLSKTNKLIKKSERPSINNSTIDFTNNNSSRIKTMTGELIENESNKGNYGYRLSQLKRKLTSPYHNHFKKSTDSKFQTNDKDDNNNDNETNKPQMKKKDEKLDYMTHLKESSADSIDNTRKSETFTNNILLEAIKLVERAKEVKKEIEIEMPKEKLHNNKVIIDK